VTAMPIEIRELVIRATVDPSEAGSGLSASSCGSPRSKAPAHGQHRRDPHSDENLVQTCVREVLRILDAKRER